MKRAILITVFATSVGLASASEIVGGVVEIPDLSPTLRLDLSASPSATPSGREIELTATLRNIADVPVVVLPGHMLARLSRDIAPRCANRTRSYGNSIAEAGVEPEAAALRLLKPGEEVTLSRFIPAPVVEACSAGGTFLVKAEYCMFYDIALDAVPGRKGCVPSNTVAVELEPGQIR